MVVLRDQSLGQVLRRRDDAMATGWLETRLREPATWRELGFTAVSLAALWWMDFLVLGFALGLPALLMLSPVDDPGAWPWLVIGLVLLSAAPPARYGRAPAPR
ncbi:sensor domain-containing protein [Streptomyces sp. A5-4]|uniref:sensor domain-containing protein n=1 Tax=Streptomyces sp. A5-4 TaxID=3384771 RepID=UPI003DA9391A